MGVARTENEKTLEMSPQLKRNPTSRLRLNARECHLNGPQIAWQTNKQFSFEAIPECKATPTLVCIVKSCDPSRSAALRRSIVPYSRVCAQPLVQGLNDPPASVIQRHWWNSQACP
ncbi:hypothetical protein HNY73_001032 [Argiope bruennichi]|uniref:Uncharacterized protein n=1 Tax=Argiope bruennichi TaxID=94029 RepID=A0A8T0G2G2_ARGBR|nr:hypothetical protein HNY73_001032 [Argiope bruennichi]